MSKNVLDYKKKLDECDIQIQKYSDLIAPHINAIHLLKISIEKKEILLKEYREYISTLPENVPVAAAALTKIQNSGCKNELRIIIDYLQENVFKQIDKKWDDSENYHPAKDKNAFFKLFNDAYEFIGESKENPQGIDE